MKIECPYCGTEVNPNFLDYEDNDMNWSDESGEVRFSCSCPECDETLYVVVGFRFGEFAKYVWTEDEYNDNI